MKIAIIGCTHAGVAAATRLLKTRPGNQVTIYERNDNVSFLSAGIPYYLSGQIKDTEKLFYQHPEQLAKWGANLKMNHNVVKIDQENKRLTVVNQVNGNQTEEDYDRLIIATGSWPRIPNVNGLDNPNIYLCKNDQQARQLFAALESGQRVIVLGGNQFGLQLAVACRQHGAQVTVVDHHPRLLAAEFDLQYSEQVATTLAANQVQLELDQPVVAVAGNDQVPVVVKTTKKELNADLVIIATELQPNSALLKGKVAMTDDGAIMTNEYLQTSDPAIYAAGDVVAPLSNATGHPSYHPSLADALRQGTIAGINVGENKVKYLGSQGTMGLRIFNEHLAKSGLTANQAQQAGIVADTVTITDNYRPEFMTPTAPVTMTLVWDKKTRRILGGELMSTHDITQSANLLSVCIQNKNTIDFLAFVDMFFEPSYDRPFNYLNILGQAAMKKDTKK